MTEHMWPGRWCYGDRFRLNVFDDSSDSDKDSRKYKSDNYGDDGNSLVSMKNENLGDSTGWVGLRG